MHETVTESFRLSPQQRHVSALQSSNLAASFPYRTYYQVRLEGPLDVLRLQRALERVVERHEILRTTFSQMPGFSMPRQVIASLPLLSFTMHDLSASGADEQEEALVSLIEQGRQHPLSLEPGPVLLVTLI